MIIGMQNCLLMAHASHLTLSLGLASQAPPSGGKQEEEEPPATACIADCSHMQLDCFGTESFKNSLHRCFSHYERGEKMSLFRPVGGALHMMSHSKMSDEDGDNGKQKIIYDGLISFTPTFLTSLVIPNTSSDIINCLFVHRSQS